MSVKPVSNSPAGEATSEPSMDEILASIRQIIADDQPAADVQNVERAGLTPPSDASNTNDRIAPSVYVPPVTNAVPPPVVPAPTVGASAKTAEAISDPFAVNTPSTPYQWPDPAEAETEAAPAAVAPPEPQNQLEADISAEMARALSLDPEPAEAPSAAAAAPFALPSPSQPSIELDKDEVARKVVERWIGTHNDEMSEAVRAVVGPVVRTWLADNLPGLVERLIREEIEAVSRGA